MDALLDLKNYYQVRVLDGAKETHSNWNRQSDWVKYSDKSVLE